MTAGSKLRRAVAGLVLLVLAGGPAEAAENPQVSNSFFNTDLRIAIEDLAAQSDVNIIAGPGVSGVVSVEFQEVALTRALDLVLTGTSYLVHEGSDYYLVYAPEPDSDMLRSVAETEVVKVSNVGAEAARELLAPPLRRYVRADNQARTLAITAPDELLRRIKADLRKIDTPAQTRTEVVPVRNLSVAAAVEALPEDLRDYVQLDEERNAAVVSAPPAVAARIQRQLRRIDVPTPDAPELGPSYAETQIVELDYVRASMASNLLPERFSEFVKTDENSNTVSISAPEGRAAEIRRYIDRMDTPRRHVMLDARVVVLDRVDLLDFGIEWDFPTAQAGTFTNDQTSDPNWPYGLQIGFTPGRAFTNALSLNLNLLSQNDDATILSSPKVLAQDGREAEISITTEEFFEVTGQDDVFTQAQLEEIETGTRLLIEPQVGSDNDITLDMDIEVSDVIARGEQNLPIVSRRTATSTVQLENGGTAAIAGLVDTRSQLGVSGIPGLSKAPGVGNAFGRDTVERRARQVAVFVTATLVDQDDRAFKTGRDSLPPTDTVDEAAFRRELKRALDKIGGDIENDPE